MATERERLSAAEAMAQLLGGFIESLLDEIRSWPKWYVSRKRRWVMEGRLVQSVSNYRDWVALYVTPEES